MIPCRPVSPPWVRLQRRTHSSAGSSDSPSVCVEHHDGHFVHVDGTGERFRYRLLPIPPNGVIELPEGGKLHP
jgi:hypothetical protein